MSDIKDFVIENGVLKKYLGSESELVIPEGVIEIAPSAFARSKKIEAIKLPESVTSVGKAAFSDCIYLKSLHLPNSLETIGEKAFSNCYNLETITLPEKVTSVGKAAFFNCNRLKSLHLPNSIETIGEDAFSHCYNLETITLPEKITTIETHSFSYCSSLKSITIPTGVTHIKGSAFSSCSSIVDIVIPDSVTTIGSFSFSKCCDLQRVVIGKNVEHVDYRAFDECYRIKCFEIQNSKTSFDMSDWSGVKAIKKFVFPEDYCRRKEKISGVFISHVVCRDSIDYAYLWLNQSGKQWDEWFSKHLLNADEVLKAIIDLILEAGKISSKQVNRVQNFISIFSARLSDGIGDQMLEVLSSKDNKATELINIEAEKKEAEKEEKKNEEELKNTIPIEKYFVEHPPRPFSAELDSVKSGVKYKEYNCNCSVPIIKMLLEEYLSVWNSNKKQYWGQMSSGYNLGPLSVLKKPVIAEKIAAELDPISLSNYLESLAYGANYRYFCIPYARFALEDSMQRCVEKITIRKKGHAKERYWAENFENAIYYSDTKAAAEYIEKHGDFKKYLRMHGMSVQEYRDFYSLPDFGFDASGSQKHTVDGKELEFRLTNSFDLAIVEPESGKVIKSISKKSGDGIKAANDYATLRKEIKDFYKKRIEYMKKTYITGEQISEELWNVTYISNPLFRPIVESAIWVDSEKTLFEVSAGKCKDLNGASYTPSGNVSIAHVLDMSKEQIEAWQNYLIANRKSLLIEQVWEPVVQIENVMAIAGRYDGIVVTKQDRNELKKVMKAKAIDVRSEAREAEYDHRAMSYVFDPNGTMLIGDNLRMDYVVDEASGNTTLGRFSSFKWSNVSKRELNAVIFEFDRITLKSFIAKDNVSRLTDTMLSCFTVAQISEFIEYSTKSNSTNCTARLLDYKNANFGEVDAFDMFVLE